MSYYIWIIVNAIFVIATTIYIWFFRSPYETYYILSGKLIAQIAVFFFAINVNLFFLIQIIKRTHWKKVKISLVKLLRKLMRYHIRIAIIGSSLVLIHAGIMIFEEGKSIGYFHIKMLAGYIALVALIVNLFAGYLRHLRASGFRRKFHLYMALTFATLFIIHIFIPI